MKKTTGKNLSVPEFSLLRNHNYYKDKTRLYIGEPGGQCSLLANIRVNNFLKMNERALVSSLFTHTSGRAY